MRSKPQHSFNLACGFEHSISMTEAGSTNAMNTGCYAGACTAIQLSHIDLPRCGGSNLAGGFNPWKKGARANRRVATFEVCANILPDRSTVATRRFFSVGKATASFGKPLRGNAADLNLMTVCLRNLQSTRSLKARALLKT